MNAVLHAVMSGKLSGLREALAAGAGVDVRDRDGATPLMQAVIQGRADLVQELIEHGAALDVQDKNGWTALHFAAQEYRVDIARSLLARGVAVDVEDANGNTPLWRAVFASQGRGEMIRLLLKHGADRKRKNRHGVSPIDLARTIANYDVMPFLTEM